MKTLSQDFFHIYKRVTTVFCMMLMAPLVMNFLFIASQPWPAKSQQIEAMRKINREIVRLSNENENLQEQAQVNHAIKTQVQENNSAIEHLKQELSNFPKTLGEYGQEVNQLAKEIGFTWVKLFAYISFAVLIVLCVLIFLIKIPLLQVGLFFTALSTVSFLLQLINPNHDLLIYNVMGICILIVLLMLLGYSYFAHLKLKKKLQFFEIYRLVGTVLCITATMGFLVYGVAIFFQPNVDTQGLYEKIEVMNKINDTRGMLENENELLSSQTKIDRAAKMQMQENKMVVERLAQEKGQVLEEIKGPWKEVMQELQTKTEQWIESIAYMNVALAVLFLILIFLIQKPLLQVSFLFAGVETAAYSLYFMSSIKAVPFIAPISYGIILVLLMLLVYSYFKH